MIVLTIDCFLLSDVAFLYFHEYRIVCTTAIAYRLKGREGG